MPAGTVDLIQGLGRGAAPGRGDHRSTGPVRASSATLCISWAIGGGASAASELRWCILGDAGTAVLHTNQAEDCERLAEAPVTRHIHDADAGLEHLEIDGLLWVTLRRHSGGPPELLFARTTLLAKLKIPGGRYAAPRLL